jgi:hypothetical protein
MRIFAAFLPRTRKMSKNRKISTEEFNFLCGLAPFVPETDQKSFKHALLRRVERVFGDKWHNLSEKTRQAIDYICFLAIDRGFIYASPDHIAQKHGIGKSTVYDALKVLREEGILYKANRCSRKQNGLGCPIHFFTIHPYFERICQVLKLDWKTERNAGRKAEVGQNASETRDSGVLEVATYSEPTHDQEGQTNDTQSNVTRIIKYVPKSINQLYAHIFGERLRHVWVKIKQAWKSIKQSMLTEDDLFSIARNVIQNLLRRWKDRMKRGEDMSVDEMCAFAYKSARESFYNAMAEMYMEVYDETVEEYLLEKERQFELAKREIACLEKYYVWEHPEARYEDMVRHVLKELKEVFPYLDRNDLAHFEENYSLYSRQYEILRDYYRRIESERLCYRFA